MVKRRKCEQNRCVYLMYGGCRECKECKAEPSIVDEDCITCHCCEFDEGAVRWDDGEEVEDEEEEEIIEKQVIIVRRKM